MTLSIKLSYRNSVKKCFNRGMVSRKYLLYLVGVSQAQTSKTVGQEEGLEIKNNNQVNDKSTKNDDYHDDDDDYDDDDADNDDDADSEEDYDDDDDEHNNGDDGNANVDGYIVTLIMKLLTTEVMILIILFLLLLLIFRTLSEFNISFIFVRRSLFLIKHICHCYLT